MKQSSRKPEQNCASLHWRKLLPPKTNPKNLRTLAHTHHELNIRRHLKQHPARQPPKTNPKNLRTLTPILEVRTPTAKALSGTSNAHVDKISRSPIARLEVRTPIRGKTVFTLKPTLTRNESTLEISGFFDKRFWNKSSTIFENDDNL